MIYKNAHHTTAAWPELLAWLEYLKVAKKRPRTLEAYERRCARLLLANPDKAFTEFTDADLLSYLAGTPELSRHIYKAPINQWFKWGYRTRRLTWNPADLLPDIRYKPNRTLKVFSVTEIAALRALEYPHGCLMTILLETGMRNQEARHLTVRRVNFRTQEILVKEGAKGGKERIVPMTAAAAGAFHELILTDGLGPYDHFWASYPGGGHRVKRATPSGHSTLDRWWRFCLKEADVEYRKPHTTRHTFATTWLDILDDGEVQDMLGHESITTTRDIYQHRDIARTGDRMRAFEETSRSSLVEEEVS